MRNVLNSTIIFLHIYSITMKNDLIQNAIYLTETNNGVKTKKLNGSKFLLYMYFQYYANFKKLVVKFNVFYNFVW